MMSVTQKKRLRKVLGLLLLGTIVVGLVIYALSQNLHLFYTPTEIIQHTESTPRAIRVGGMVKVGSLKRGDGLQVEFILTDFQEQVAVQYEGVLPDLFKENQGVVVLGKYDPITKKVIAEQVLAKHDENYMPPEVKKALKK